MKRIIVLALFIISSNLLFSQNAGDLTLSELETKLKEAQSSKNKTDEDYYSKAISLRKRIDLAVKSEEYETANKLKLELKNLSKGGNTSERAKLEDDLKSDRYGRLCQSRRN
jgi:flagellar motility protein MotE (MotC chaperone)